LRARAEREEILPVSPPEDEVMMPSPVVDGSVTTLETAEPVAAEPLAPAPEPGPPPSVAFAALTRLSDAALKELVSHVGNRDLLMALRGSDQALRERMLTALPFGRRVTVQTRLKSPQPLPLSAITAAQERIYRFAQTLSERETRERCGAAVHV
jgi:hypothetical protein